MKDLFLLDPNITYLNFGSFGACPKAVFTEYQRIQLELEQRPVQFMISTGIKELNNSRFKLANYLSCEPDDLVYMTNPSYAINTIAKSIPLAEGDEILTTNLEYGAMDRTWNYYCNKAGAKYIRQEINFPIKSKAHFLDEFWKGCTPNTKIVFISHITSSTALILPVEEIIIEAKRRGLLTIIDGAHVPGQLPLNINKLDADIYVGACHKWMMSEPKSQKGLQMIKKALRLEIKYTWDFAMSGNLIKPVENPCFWNTTFATLGPPAGPSGLGCRFSYFYTVSSFFIPLIFFYTGIRNVLHMLLLSRPALDCCQ